MFQILRTKDLSQILSFQLYHDYTVGFNPKLFHELSLIEPLHSLSHNINPNLLSNQVLNFSNHYKYT